ncbi:helix-turn-helix transcriptional regulator [Marivita sp. S0852]|uniref:helix-turn-helix transcriptional regulator n=1 Tax=Marivita sp. S0852 TaxID=3373893 RepID=UPI003982D692
MAQAQQNVVSIDVYGFLGRRLRELRTARGLTQAEVARTINVSPQQYQKYEDAQSKCNLTYVIALADFYGVHVNSILPVDAPSTDVADPAPIPAAPPAPSPAKQEADADLPQEADLLARLVSSFVRLTDANEKRRLVQLVEAIVTAHEK